MSSWWSPISFLRWLLAGERLDSVATSADAAAPQSPRQGFLRWLVSSEELPELEPDTQGVRPVGLLRYIFSSERLPDDSTINTPGGNQA